MEKIYEVTYKNGYKENLVENKVPKFTAIFNTMVKNLNIGEEMHDMDSMTTIKRIS